MRADRSLSHASMEGVESSLSTEHEEKRTRPRPLNGSGFKNCTLMQIRNMKTRENSAYIAAGHNYKGYNCFDKLRFNQKLNLWFFINDSGNVVNNYKSIAKSKNSPVTCQATLKDITVNGKSYACIIEHPEFNEFRNENGILIIDPDYHERSQKDKEAFLKEVTVEFTKEEEEQFLEAFNQVNKKVQWLAKEKVLKIQSKLKTTSDEYNAREAPVKKRKTLSSETHSTTAKIQRLMDAETPNETKSASPSHSEAVAIPAETSQSGSSALSATPTQTPVNPLAGSALFFPRQQTPARQVPRRFTPKVITHATFSHCLHVSYMTGMPQQPQPLLWLPSPSPFAASSPHMFANLQQPSQSLSSLPVDTFFRAYSAN